MKLLRYFFLSLLALILIIPVGAYILLSVYGVDELKPLIISKVYEATGRQLAIDGDFSITPSFTPSLKVTGIRFSNAQWAQKQPDMLQLDELLVNLDITSLLSKKIIVDQISLRGGTIALQQQGKKRNWELDVAQDASMSSSTLPKTTTHSNNQQEFTLNIEKLLIEDVTAYISIDGQEHHAKVDLFDVGLDPTAKASVILHYNGAKIATEFSSNATTIDELMLHAIAYDIEIRAEEARLSLIGEVMPSMSAPTIRADIEASVASLDRLNGLLPGVDFSPSPAIMLSTSTKTDNDRIHTSIDAFAYGEMEATGTVKLSRHQPMRDMDIALAVQTLDIAALSGDADETATTAQDGVTATPSANNDVHAPLPFDILQKVSGTIDVTIAQLTRDDKVFASDIALKSQIKEAGLQLEQLVAQLPSGMIEATGRIDAHATPTQMFDITLRDANIGTLLSHYTDHDAVEGGLSQAHIHLSSRGSTRAAIEKALGGSVVYVVGNAEYRIPPALADTGNFLNHLRGKQTSGSSAPLQCAVGEWILRGDRATVKQAFIDVPASLVALEGYVAYLDDSLDLRINTHPKRAGLTQLPVPIRVSGSVSSPRVVPDAASVVSNLANIGLGQWLQQPTKGSAVGKSFSNQRFPLPENCLSDLAALQSQTPTSTRDSLKRVEDDIKEDFKNITDKLKGL
ncbi:MAG: AsmA family protein [Sphaerospermopsis sp. SIO1G2]|nr:AsmA family protein [Sphaerospermopsis sp. SIO1G2]